MATPATIEKRRLGKTAMEVSVLGFGGSEIGYENVPVETVEKLLNNALDAGLNVIDTAACYPNSEELIGRAAAGRRKDFHLFTKCGHPERMGEEDWRPDSLLKTIERSLKRLRTDYLDLIQLHNCPEEDLKKGDAIEALMRARERGYARYIGCSADRGAARYVIECGKFDTLQTSVSIADQEAVETTLPLALERGIGVIVKRPIANAAWKFGRRPPPRAYHHTYWERLGKLDYDFLHGDLKSAVSIALRFTLNLPGVHTAIVGTTKPGRWRENAALLADGPLPKEQFDAIRARWKEVAGSAWLGQI